MVGEITLSFMPLASQTALADAFADGAMAMSAGAFTTFGMLDAGIRDSGLQDSPLAKILPVYQQAVALGNRSMIDLLGPEIAFQINETSGRLDKILKPASLGLFHFHRFAEMPAYLIRREPRFAMMSGDVVTLSTAKSPCASLDGKHIHQKSLTYQDLLRRLQESEKSGIFIQNLGEMMAQIESIEERLEIALNIESRLGDTDRFVRARAVKALAEVIPYLERQDRLKWVLKIEACLGDNDSWILKLAIEALVEVLPHLQEKDRLDRVLKIESRFQDKAGNIHHTVALDALTKTLPHLETADCLTLALKLESRLRDDQGDICTFAVDALAEAIPYLPEKDRVGKAWKIESCFRDGDRSVLQSVLNSLAKVIPHLQEADRLTLTLKIESRLGVKDQDVRFFVVQTLARITPNLQAADRLTLALKLESRLRNHDWDIRRFALHALAKMIPHLEKGALLNLEKKSTGEGARVGGLSRILKTLTNYNRDLVVKLVETEISRVQYASKTLSRNLHLWADIFERWPRLGYPVLEGLIEAAQKEIVPKEMFSEREAILKFIEATHGFVPVVYGVYKKEGEAVLKKIQAYTASILNDTLGLNEARQIVEDHEAYGGMEFLLAVVQSVSPMSGASFVGKMGQIGLLKKMLEAGDRREDIPVVWRGIVKTFALEQGEWKPKGGETIDPEGEIKTLLTQFRVGENGKMEEAKAIEALKIYLQSERHKGDLEKLRSVLFAYAGSQDALREKIDRIQDNNYAALDLLDQLFRDKDNMSVMIKELLDKVPVALLTRREKVDSAAKVPLQDNPDKLIGALRRLWNQQEIDEAKRLRGLANMLRPFSPEDVESKIVERADIKETPLAEAIHTALREGPAITKHEIADVVLSDPLKLIEREKFKFAYQAGEPIQIGVRAVKGPAFGLYGLSAGVCTATDIALWENPSFKLLAITDEASKQVVGYIHVFESKDAKGNKIITLPGINPSTEFMGTVDAEKLYDGIVAQVIEFAKIGGYHGVYLPTNANIHSNRQGIQKTIRAKSYPTTTLPEVTWNTVPSPYPFTEVFKVWSNK